MKNIKVTVDATSSADLNAIEKYLLNMKMDPSLEKDKVHVSFFTSTRVLEKELTAIETPLTFENINGNLRTPSSFNPIIYEALSPDVDALIFIGDFMDEGIKKESIRNPNTKILFVSTQSTPEPHFIADLKDLPNIRSTTTDKYISLGNLFNNDVSFQDKLDKIRTSTNTNNSKLTP